MSTNPIVTYRTRNTVIGLIVLIAAAGVAWTIETHRSTASADGAAPIAADSRAANVQPSGSSASQLDYATSLSQTFRSAAERVLPSVVTIQRTAAATKESVSRFHNRGGQLPDDSPFNQFFSDPLLKRFFEDMPNMPNMPETPQGRQSSVGSGVIIDAGGTILTNNHVVAGGGKILVRLHDGREFEATDVKTDPRTDLAVVRIKGAGSLPAVALGDSDQLQIGDWVIAVGNPFGLEETVTAGIISAKARGLGITAREDFLQTDAAINPGNSGGPLVNLRGEVVGINTAISSTNGGYQGVGFAIPINLAKWVSRQLIDQGVVMRAYLGVGIQPVTPELAGQLGLKDASGALVSEVRNGSPASQAGVKVGDVVLEFGGRAISGPRDLQTWVEQSAVGSKQPLSVIRDGKRMTLNVSMHEQPKEYGLAANERGSDESAKGEAFENLGLEVATLTADVADQLGLSNAQGVVITAVHSGSPADMAGLRETMVIQRVGQTTVRNVDEFRAAMKQQSLGKGVMLLVRTQEGSRFVVIKQ